MTERKARDLGYRRLPMHEAKKEAALAAAHRLIRTMAVRLDIWRMQSGLSGNDPAKAAEANAIVEALVRLQVDFEDAAPIRLSPDGRPLGLEDPPPAAA